MDNKLGFIGTALTIGSGLLGWMTDHEAELRAVSFAFSIVVGLLTTAWWLRKWWRVFSGWAAEKLD